MFSAFNHLVASLLVLQITRLWDVKQAIAKRQFYVGSSPIRTILLADGLYCEYSGGVVFGKMSVSRRMTDHISLRHQRNNI